MGSCLGVQGRVELEEQCMQRGGNSSAEGTVGADGGKEEGRWPLTHPYP